MRAAGTRSGLTIEFGRESRDEWESQYETMLTGGDAEQRGFEHRTLRKASSAWARWRKWIAIRSPDQDPYEVQAVHLAAFFKAVSTRGPTAASGVFDSLKWIRRYVKITLPLEATVVAKYELPAPGHTPHRNPL